MITCDDLTEATNRLGELREAVFRKSESANSVDVVIRGLGVDEDALLVWAQEAIQILVNEHSDQVLLALPAALVNGFLIGVIAGRLGSDHVTHGDLDQLYAELAAADRLAASAWKAVFSDDRNLSDEFVAADAAYRQARDAHPTAHD